MIRPHTFLVLLAACSGPSQQLPPAWIGTDDAVRSGLMAGESDRSQLLDEARLSYLQGSTACFDLTVRSDVEADTPLARLGGTCTAGGSSPIELSSDEMLSVYDYAETGDVAAVVSEDTPAAGWDAAGADPPASTHTRVVERRARVCCQVGAADTIVLSLRPSANRSIELSWDMQ